jgi:hypothetical protein
MRRFSISILASVVSICLASACGEPRGEQPPRADTAKPEAADTPQIAPEAARVEPSRQPTQPTSTSMTPCETAIQRIRDRDFADWRGFPPECDWTPLTGPLPDDWREVPGRPLGTSFRDAKMIMLPLDGYSRPSLSFVDGAAALFEAMGPELATEVPALLAALGEPAARLDWDFGTLPCPESEFVYPDRGITLFLSADHGRVFHVALYAATDLDDYLANRRPRLGKKRLPRK